jgi:hypothetical protein
MYSHHSAAASDTVDSDATFTAPPVRDEDSMDVIADSPDVNESKVS